MCLSARMKSWLVCIALQCYCMCSIWCLQSKHTDSLKASHYTLCFSRVRCHKLLHASLLHIHNLCPASTAMAGSSSRESGPMHPSEFLISHDLVFCRYSLRRFLLQSEEFGRRLAHQFPWSPAASVAVGLALRRRYQGHSGAPSLAAHRKEIIRVCLSCSLLSSQAHIYLCLPALLSELGKIKCSAGCYGV